MHEKVEGTRKGDDRITPSGEGVRMDIPTFGTFIDMPDLATSVGMAIRFDVIVGSMMSLSWNSEFVKRFIKSVNIVGGKSGTYTVLDIPFGDALDPIAAMFPLLCDFLGNLLEHIDGDGSTGIYKFGDVGNKVLEHEVREHKQRMRELQQPTFNHFDLSDEIDNTYVAIKRFLAYSNRYQDLWEMTEDVFQGNMGGASKVPLDSTAFSRDELVDHVYTLPGKEDEDAYNYDPGKGFNYLSEVPKATLIVAGIIQGIFDKYIQGSDLTILGLLSNIYSPCQDPSRAPNSVSASPVCLHLLETEGIPCYEDGGCCVFRRRMYCGTCFKL
jgi:hypothetical protein